MFSCTLLNVMKQFYSHRFDPGNKEFLRYFDEDDVIGLAKAGHPLVSVLLHRLVEYDNENFRHSDDDDDDSDDDEEFEQSPVDHRDDGDSDDISEDGSEDEFSDSDQEQDRLQMN